MNLIYFFELNYSWFTVLWRSLPFSTLFTLFTLVPKDNLVKMRHCLNSLLYTAKIHISPLSLPARFTVKLKEKAVEENPTLYERAQSIIFLLVLSESAFHVTVRFGIHVAPNHIFVFWKSSYLKINKNSNHYHYTLGFLYSYIIQNTFKK